MIAMTIKEFHNVIKEEDKIIKKLIQSMEYSHSTHAGIIRYNKNHYSVFIGETLTRRAINTEQNIIYLIHANFGIIRMN